MEAELEEGLMQPAVQVEVRGPPLPIVERYYTKYYAVDVNGHPREDFCILQHSNRHLDDQNRKTVNKVTSGRSPDSTTQVNFCLWTTRLEILTDGRIKCLENEKISLCFLEGGQKLTPSSPLCTVTLKDGSKFVLYSCIKAFLVEMNESLIANPNLLISKPLGEGYIAIVMSKLDDADKVCSELLSEKQYKEALGGATTGN